MIRSTKSVVAEIDPTDEEFEGKKERGIIKEQTFDPDEIEVGGEKINYQLSRILRKNFQNPPQKYQKDILK